MAGTNTASPTHMEIKTLYDKLMTAYSDENLNQIARKLIELYKKKNHETIRGIAHKISKYVPIEEEKDAKCFSKLMMLYHPDKGEHIRKTLQTLYEQNNYAQLESYAHVLLLGNLEQVIPSAIDEEVDYNPEYEWDSEAHDGFGYADEENDTEDWGDADDYEKSFYNLIKIREYGNVHVEFPPYYLEDFEEFEMAYSGLESLDGVEHCMHIKILDISNNQIADIGNLWDLVSLEELYLANNQIGYIDTLSNLTNLRVLDLSGNPVDDLSPLMHLENLEYVNLVGTTVPEDQVKALKEKDILVMTEEV